jgi:retron-type reverse transcriptase
MYYLTYKTKNYHKDPHKNLSLANILKNFNELNNTSLYPMDVIPEYQTYTKEIDICNPELAEHYLTPHLKQSLINLWEESKHMLVQDMSVHYHYFLIPKSSGGQRQIMAPNDELKDYLRWFVSILQDDMHILFHDSAFAYAKGRSSVDAVKRHQSNESKWFLKLDMKDFFPSCNYENVNNTLRKIFPICELYNPNNTREALEGMLKLCFVDDALPQGTPTSPILTNLLMLPLDYKIHRLFKNFDCQYFVYTRYADDMLISSKFTFQWRDLTTAIKQILDPVGLKINHEKTRYGSINGRNWNLGLMLNKDNSITIGHKRKKELKAMIHNFLTDYKKHEPWDKNATQVFLGQLSYATQVEPDYFKFIIDRASTDHGISFREASLQILRTN